MDSLRGPISENYGFEIMEEKVVLFPQDFSDDTSLSLPYGRFILVLGDFRAFFDASIGLIYDLSTLSINSSLSPSIITTQMLICISRVIPFILWWMLIMFYYWSASNRFLPLKTAVTDSASLLATPMNHKFGIWTQILDMLFLKFTIYRGKNWTVKLPWKKLGDKWPKK